MRQSTALLATMILALTGCGDGGGDGTRAANDPGGSPSSGEASPSESSSRQRGGIISVGDGTWTIVPSTQCSIFPGNVVSIAGRAAEDESLEIVLDYGGPNQVRIGEGDGALWHARSDTIEAEVDGRTLRGTADFTPDPAGTGEATPGWWEVTC